MGQRPAPFGTHHAGETVPLLSWVMSDLAARSQRSFGRSRFNLERRTATVQTAPRVEVELVVVSKAPKDSAGKDFTSGQQIISGMGAESGYRIYPLLGMDDDPLGRLPGCCQVST